MHQIPGSDEATSFALQMGYAKAVISVQVPLYIVFLNGQHSFPCALVSAPLPVQTG